MTRAILRSVVVGVLTIAAIGLTYLVRQTLFCPLRRPSAGIADRGAAILDRGYLIARPGDAIYACVVPHCFGPLGCHEDRGCYCAPASMGSALVGERLGGRCVVDQPAPSPSDDRGACRRARCDEHVDP